VRPAEVLLELCDGRTDMLDPKLNRPRDPLPPFINFVVSLQTLESTTGRNASNLSCTTEHLDL